MWEANVSLCFAYILSTSRSPCAACHSLTQHILLDPACSQWTLPRETAVRRCPKTSSCEWQGALRHATAQPQCVRSS